MKSFLFIFALLFSLSFANAQASQTIPYLSGVPVMKGFQILPDSILVFDKPQGQIAQVSLICDNNCPDSEQVIAYYRDNLMALGWIATKLSPRIFRKHKRQIRFDYVSDTENQSDTILTFYTE